MMALHMYLLFITVAKFCLYAIASNSCFNDHLPHVLFRLFAVSRSLRAISIPCACKIFEAFLPHTFSGNFLTIFSYWKYKFLFVFHDPWNFVVVQSIRPLFSQNFSTETHFCCLVLPLHMSEYCPEFTVVLEVLCYLTFLYFFFFLNQIFPYENLLIFCILSVSIPVHLQGWNFGATFSIL